jgi:drug/metabolite transporter (DMT)-like permease
VNAAFQTLTRRLATDDEDPLLGQWYVGFFGLVIFSVTLLAVGSFRWDLTPWQWTVLAGVAVAGTTGHFFLLHAFARANAATLAPFTYIQIGLAMLGGWLAFGHAPDAWAVLGMVIIAGSGALSGWFRARA